MRTLGRVWLVEGQLRRIIDTEEEQKKPLRQRSLYTPKWETRIIFLESTHFPTEMECRTALLHGWSNNPHEARLRSIQFYEPKYSTIIPTDGTTRGE